MIGRVERVEGGGFDSRVDCVECEKFWTGLTGLTGLIGCATNEVLNAYPPSERECRENAEWFRVLHK